MLDGVVVPGENVEFQRGRTREDEMAGITSKSFDTPDERRAPDKTQVEVVDLGSVKVGRMTLQPGWRWSECIKPVAGTERCEVHHVGTMTSGRLHVEHAGGSSVENGPGEAHPIEPRHHAWVLGSEPARRWRVGSQAD